MITSLTPLHNVPALIFEELRLACSDVGHPFRLFTIGSTNGEEVRVRTVVLRMVDNRRNIWIFTDGRSAKVTHFKNKETASLLFYDPQRQVQVVCQAVPTLFAGTAKAKELWNEINDHARGQYQTRQAPGKKVGSLAEAVSRDLSFEDQHFCPVSFRPVSLEILQLAPEGHLRARYVREEDVWTGSWLVP